MEVVDVKVHDLDPNPWNVNRMDPEMRRKLAEYLQREGLVEPIVVRPHPEKEGRFEILGGFHRWTIWKELERESIPVVVVPGLDDRRAKILSINLNSMKGEAVPSLLSDLLTDLQQETPLADLEATLPYAAGEIQDFLDLMQIPEGFAEDMEADAEGRAVPTVLTLVLEPAQAALWDAACGIAEAEVAGAKNPNAATLALVLSAFLALRTADVPRGTS